MITLEGKLRRIAELEIKGEKRTKLTLEYELPRYDGEGDLKLTDFFVDPLDAAGLVVGSSVVLAVRPYASGREVAFSALGVLDVSRKDKAA